MNPILETILSFGVITSFVLPLTMALVTYLGKFGVSGKWQLVSSMVTGLLLGGGLAFVTLGGVANMVNIMSSLLYGITVGLSASGVYDALKEASTKGQQVAITRAQEAQEPLTKSK